MTNTPQHLISPESPRFEPRSGYPTNVRGGARAALPSSTWYARGTAGASQGRFVIDVSRRVSHGGDFDAIKHRLDTTLTDHVRRLSAERERTYAYKVRALDDVFLKGDPASKRLDPVEWRLECERRRLWDSIRALDTPPVVRENSESRGYVGGYGLFPVQARRRWSGGYRRGCARRVRAAGADNRGFARREPNRAGVGRRRRGEGRD